MRVFVGFGYNERDQWIEKQVFPILSSMGFTVVHGKAMQGKELPPEIKSRIEQSDAAIGFLTIREGQEQAEFNSHVWVLSEMVYADAKGKPIIPVKEDSVHDPRGLLGNRQFITLRQNDRLACVVELVETLGRRNIRDLSPAQRSRAARRNCLGLQCCRFQPAHRPGSAAHWVDVESRRRRTWNFPRSGILAADAHGWCRFQAAGRHRAAESAALFRRTAH